MVNTEVKMNAVSFIEARKEQYFHWMYQVAPKNFPRICEFASDVLGCWIYLTFPNDKIKIQSVLYDGWSHSWLEIDGKIVDFTITQFMGGLDQDERHDLSDGEFYTAYFLKYHSTPFIAGDLTANYEIEEGLFICQYDCAKWCVEHHVDFDTYLKAIASGNWWKHLNG